LTSRLLADRRGGVDRRTVPRRTILALVRVDRRNSTMRPRSTETPAEHVRNGLQLLHHLHASDGLHIEQRADLDAALHRLQRALELLERRSRS